ncbi:hypothetical protein DER45DRAFT_626985 [Fusarium avenaceum]|nr:hypothetical protein DER45DRAFT_626985 [Fusarium avenaceum]
MSSNITTSLLMLEYSGVANLHAEVIGANPTATTFVLNCEKPKNKKTWDIELNECYVTDDTVVVGPWADKTPAPGAVTTGVWRYHNVVDDEDWGYSFSIECEMDQTMPRVCTTTNFPSFSRDDQTGPTATFTKHGGTTVDFFFYAGWGYFDWTPVTVTAGQEYLLATNTAAFTEAAITRDVSGVARAAKATTTQAVTTGINSSDEDLISVTGDATSAKTSGSGTCTSRALSLCAAVGLVVAVIF